MNNHNEEDILEPTLTLNRLLAWVVIGAILWAALIHGAVKIWEVLQ